MRLTQLKKKELNNEKRCLRVGCDVEVEILRMASVEVDHHEQPVLGANDGKVRGDKCGGLIITYPFIRFFL